MTDASEKPDRMPASEEVEPGTLVPSPLGHGMLRHGAKPGTNRGGSGRPADKIRKLALQKSPRAIHELYRILTAEGSADADKIKAAKALLETGVPKQSETITPTSPEVKALVRRALVVIDEELRDLPERRQRIIQRYEIEVFTEDPHHGGV